MASLNDEHQGGYRPLRNNQPPQQDTGRPVMTIAGRGPGEAPPVMPSKATTVGSAFAALQAVVEAQRQHNSEVHAVAQHYTIDGLKARLREFGGTETARMVDQAEHVVAVRENIARDRYREMIGGQMDTSADAAQEQRNSRYLDQARRRIEAGSEPGQQIAAARAELARAADRNQRGLLAEELTTLFPDDHGWIQGELSRLDPELASAAAELHNAELAHQAITHAANGVRGGIREGQPVTEQFLRTLAPAIVRFDPDAPA
jgi:hypothetical protein